MDLALWIIAGVLAAAFLGAGAMKLTAPREKLEENMAWVTDASDSQVKLIGLAEVLGAVGLILPAALDIVPVLVPVAASGLVITMIGAVATHLRRGEGAAAAAPAIVLGALSAFVAIMRFGPQAF